MDSQQIFLVDVLITCSSFVALVLRGSRHFSIGPVEFETSNSFGGASSDVPSDGSNSAATPTALPPAWHQLRSDPTAREPKFVFSSCRVTRAATAGAAMLCGCREEGGTSHCRLCRTRAAMRLLTSVAYYSNILSLTSNCMTHLLRHSQIFYAFLLAAGDALVLTRPAHHLRDETRLSRFRVGAVLHRFARWRYVLLLLSLSLVLQWSYSHIEYFWVGDIAGYVAGLSNLFLFGATMAGPSPVLVASRRRVRSEGLGQSVILEFVGERLAAMVASVCYLYMLWEEGEAVYSSHMEVVRWYGCVTATLLIDTTQLVRFLWTPQLETT